MKVVDETQTQVEQCSVIDGVAVNPTEEHQDHASFLDEACLSGTVVSDKSWWNVFRQTPRFNAAEVFARPYLAYTGTWNDSVIPQYTSLLRVDNITNNALWSAHLYGRACLRATWCFRVEVSNSPFMGGWLRLSHVPKISNGVPASYAYTVSRLRQLPGVDLNIATNTAAVIRIPHRTIEPWFRLDVTTPVQDNGYFVVWRRTPLNQGDGAAPRFSVWFWLEDVEIVGTALPASLRTSVVPQAGGIAGSDDDIKKAVTLGRSALAKQGSRQVSGESQQQGPLSTFLNAGARVLTTYGARIPLLGAYAEPLSWAARMSAKVASAFGFSRPLDQRPIIAHRRHQYGTFNATGIENAYVMAVSHDTSVPPVPIAGVQEDQMTVAFLAQQLFPLCEVRIPDTTPSSALITCGVLGPSNHMRHPAPGNQCPPYFDYGTALLQPPSGTVGISSLVPSAGLWLSSWFTYWRGSIRFRLLFSKTQLVSGRMIFLWNYDYQRSYYFATSAGPVAVPSPNIKLPASISTSHVDNKVIIDLRETTDVEIIVPFFAPVPLVPTIGGIGSWGLYMLDPINHPASTAAYIDVAVECSFMEDFFVAGPRASFLVPDDAPSPVIAQAGGEHTAADTAALSKGYDAASTLDIAAATVGEDVRSVKQLALLPFSHPYASNLVNPWVGLAVYRDANNQYVAPGRNTIVDHIRHFYAIERGGMNVTFMLAGGQTDANLTATITDPANGAFVPPSHFPVVVDLYSNSPRFNLPRYAPLGASYNVIANTPVNTWPVAGYFMDGTYRNVAGYSTSVSRAIVSVADDYMATLFTSTTPMFCSFMYQNA